MYRYPKDKNSLEYNLQRPFKESDIDWRISRSGCTNGRIWASVLAYVDARAVQQRLDDVFGVMGWQTEVRQSGNGFICRLSAYDIARGQWVHKEDGADETDFEAYKGGISGSWKRVAASGFGIGRYLYSLTENFADISETRIDKTWFKGDYKDASGKKCFFYWKPPALPSWAIEQ